MTCTVIIVTHNSEQTIQQAMNCLAEQTLPPEKIIIVDSGSHSPSYLTPYQALPHVEVCLAGKDIGFCCGNNLGIERLPAQSRYVFLLNPDAFLTPNYLAQAVAFMEDPVHQSCGALTGTLLGYELGQGVPSGKYDSTGVFCTWYGKWYDRDQGKAVSTTVRTAHETVPALCGAAFFCRRRAIEQVLLRGSELLDSTFYMYKEDIDLSLRLRDKGWSLAYLPALQLYHCRGWNRDRRQMPRKFRLYSAWNELRIHWRLKQPVPIAYSFLKFAAVKCLDL